jgi:hypothetical protein
MVWTMIDQDETGKAFDASFKQRAFGVEFTLKDKLGKTVLNDNEVQAKFDAWLDNYKPQIDGKHRNANIYSRSNNKFLVGKTDRYFDRFIPLVGSYRNDNLRSMFATCSQTAEQTFLAVLSGKSATVRHFMLGVMPEKVRFKATNMQTYAEFCESVGGSFASCVSQYLQDDEQVIYTGRYRLVVVMSGDNQYFGSTGLPAYSIVRQVSEPFSPSGARALTMSLIMHYRKMFLEDAAHWLGGKVDAGFDETRFLGSLMVSREQRVEVLGIVPRQLLRRELQPVRHRLRLPVEGAVHLWRPAAV